MKRLTNNTDKSFNKTSSIFIEHRTRMDWSNFIRTCN